MRDGEAAVVRLAVGTAGETDLGGVRARVHAPSWLGHVEVVGNNRFSARRPGSQRPDRVTTVARKHRAARWGEALDRSAVQLGGEHVNTSSKAAKAAAAGALLVAGLGAGLALGLGGSATAGSATGSYASPGHPARTRAGACAPTRSC